MSENQLQSCRNCKHKDLELVIDLGMQPWGNDFRPLSDPNPSARYPLQTFFCHHCCMVQLGYTVPKEVMFIEHNYLSGTTRSLTQHFRDVRDKILARNEFNTHDYVLDIGGNDGTFLSTFLEKNIKVLNVDSGKRQAVKSAENKVECINDFFNKTTAEKIIAEHGQAKVIHGSGVFFHLEELHSVFTGIKLALQPDGMVIAEFIYLPAMVQNGAFDQIYHEHLLYYTIQSFQNLLSAHNLMIFDAEISPIHGGSCIAFICHEGKKPKTAALQTLLQAEEEGQFNSVKTYRQFANTITKIRDNLIKLIHTLRKDGKVIHALGAPVKGSTIINYCGFSEKELELGVEVNPLKCNTYFPGTRIPVYHQDTAPVPDVYLLLSWNFKDEILSKLAAFREQGGKIIVPIPEPVLI